MDTNPLFTLALGLASPWRVTETIFDADQRLLDLRLAYADSAHFPCPSCGVADCPVYDADEKQWRHLDFFVSVQPSELAHHSFVIDASVWRHYVRHHPIITYDA